MNFLSIQDLLSKPIETTYHSDNNNAQDIQSKKSAPSNVFKKLFNLAEICITQHNSSIEHKIKRKIINPNTQIINNIASSEKLINPQPINKKHLTATELNIKKIRQHIKEYPLDSYADISTSLHKASKLVTSLIKEHKIPYANKKNKAAIKKRKQAKQIIRDLKTANPQCNDIKIARLSKFSIGMVKNTLKEKKSKAT